MYLKAICNQSKIGKSFAQNYKLYVFRFKISTPLLVFFQKYLTL